jgi:olfactory receptor
MYLVTILESLFTTLAVSSDSHLHTPMYFFLSSLFFNDVFLTTCTIPKMLVSIQTQDQSITLVGCFTQVFFFLILVNMENCLLAIMAHCHYVAICHHLRYQIIMISCLCLFLVMFSILVSIMNALVNSPGVLYLSFRTELGIPHFFCELTQITKFTCSDTLIDNILMCFIFHIWWYSSLWNCFVLYSHCVLCPEKVIIRRKVQSFCLPVGLAFQLFPCIICQLLGYTWAPHL